MPEIQILKIMQSQVSGYLLIDWGDAPDGVVDQVVELVGLASADDFESSDIVV